MPKPDRYSALGMMKQIEAGALWSGNWGSLGKGLPLWTLRAWNLQVRKGLK